MQTNKIRIEGVYAVNGSAGKLVRFKVMEIVTRKRSERGQVVNEVHGHYITDNAKPDPITGLTPRPATYKLNPTDLLGPYAEYSELVEQERIAKEAKAREQDGLAVLARIQRLKLYNFVGVKPPADIEATGQLFYIAKYDRTRVTVTADGTKALIERICADQKEDA